MVANEDGQVEGGERSQSISSVRSTSSLNIRLRKRQQREEQSDNIMDAAQVEFDAISSCGESNSSGSTDGDQRMGNLPEGDEGDDTMLTDHENSDDDSGASLDEDAPLPRALAQSGPLVSESPQDEDSRHD